MAGVGHWSKKSATEVAAIRAKMGEKVRQAWADRQNNGLGTRVNGAFQTEVQEQISNSVKARWDAGAYDTRVNGMLGMGAAKNPGWTWGRRDYHAILVQHEKRECALCGSTDSKVNAHHVDENRQNYLLSNLMWLCVPCHMWKMHYKKRRLPMVRLSKKFSFEYAHILPWHPGKCAQLHGHSGHLEISVEGRLDPTGIVMDFKDIGDAAKLAVVRRLDHRFLNDYIANPTSEYLLIWVWRALEDIGLKGLVSVAFAETDSSVSVLTRAAMLEAFGWDRDAKGKWVLVNKPW